MTQVLTKVKLGRSDFTCKNNLKFTLQLLLDMLDSKRLVWMTGTGNPKLVRVSTLNRDSSQR